MKLIVSCLLLSLPGLAGAQSLSDPQPSMNEPNYSTYAVSAAGYIPLTDTPTMKRYKLKRAIALREEALALQHRDGGALTPQHQTYVRRKAFDILSPGR